MVISFMYWEGRKPAHYMGSEDNLQESLSPSTIVVRREYSQPGMATSISLHNLSHQLYHISKSIIKIFNSTVFTILTGMCKYYQTEFEYFYHLKKENCLGRALVSTPLSSALRKHR